VSLLARIRAALRRRGYRPEAAATTPTAPVPPGRFAFVTSCYDTPPEFVRELAGSIRAQTSKGATWVLLDNGSTKAATRACLDVLGSEPNVHFIRVRDNCGILGGMRACLEAAQADFVLPVDADDLVAADAIASFDAALRADPTARFLFADEDHLQDGRRYDPFRRVGWDPVLAMANSYIWHLCGFDRREALRLAVYADAGANFCHDWDTLLRFVRAGHTPHHVPKVLYTWRTHAASTTNNKSDANQGSLRSQQHVLELHLRACGLHERFAVEDCPLWRGAPELRLRRLPVLLPPVDLLVAADTTVTAERLAAIAGENARVPPRRRWLWTPSPPVTAPAGWQLLHGDAAAVLAAVAGSGPPATLSVRDAGSDVREPDWILEGLGWFELVADLDVVGPRALDRDDRVRSAGDFPTRTDDLGAPDAGRTASDPGYLAMALKPRSCAAVHSGALLLRGERLPAIATALQAQPVTPATLGAFAAAAAGRAGRRTMSTPFITAVDRSAASHLPTGAALLAWRQLAGGAFLAGFARDAVWLGANRPV
jgi:hypothetical protein